MRHAWIALPLGLIVSACASGNQPSPPAADPAKRAAETKRLTTYLDAEYEEELAMSPEELTAQGRKEQYDKLDDRSLAAEARRLEWRRTSVAEMKTSFNYDLLEDDGKTSFDIWS